MLMAVTFDADAITQAFQGAINRVGITPPDSIEPGKITRFSDDGGKNKNAWAIFFIKIIKNYKKNDR